MEKIVCSVITQNILDLAKELDMSASIVNNLVSVWQTAQNSAEIPNAKELKEFKEKLSKEELDNLELALPQYSAIDYKEGGKLVYVTNNGEIVLSKFLAKKDRTYFEDYILGKLNDTPESKQKQKVFEKLAEREGYTIDKIREILPDNSSIYRFLLWYEMSHIENNDREKYWAEEKKIYPDWIEKSNEFKKEHKNLLSEDKIEIEYRATLEALQKAEKYNKISKSKSNSDYSSILNEETIKEDLTTFLSPLYTEFTPLERQRRVNTLAKDFSVAVDSAIEDIVYDIEEKLEDENISKKEKEKLKSKLYNYNSDSSKYTQYFSENSIENIIEEVVKKYENKINNTQKDIASGKIEETKGQEIILKVQKVIDNVRPLVYLASSDIGFTLGVEITLDTKNKSGNSNTDITDENAEDDPVGDTSWAFKARKTSTFSGFSASARRVLGNLKYEQNGIYKKDDIGEYIYLNPRESYINLITEAAGKVVRPEDFSIKNADGSYSFPFLESILYKYPQFRELITHLKYDAKLISNFYSVLNVSYINQYGIRVSKESGKLVPIHLNRPKQISLLTHLIDSNYKMGSIFDSHSIYNSEGKIILDNIRKGLTILDSIENDIETYTEENSYNSIAVNYTKLVNMLGIKISEAEIKASIGNNENTIKDFHESLYNIYRKLAKDFSSPKEISSLYDQAPKFFRSLFSKLVYTTVTNDALTFVTKGNRQLLSYQQSDNMETVLNTLKDPSKVLNFLSEEFSYDEFLYNPETEEYKTEWLQLLKYMAENDKSFEGVFEVQELQDIDGKEYKSWTEEDIAMANIKMFFTPSLQNHTQLSTGHDAAYYLSPIGSDSETAKFIQFVKYEKEDLIPKFRQIVKQELFRIQSILSSEEKGDSRIANYNKIGKEFCFFPELNKIHIGSQSFIEKIVELNASSDIDGINSLIDQTLTSILQYNFEEFKRLFDAKQLSELGDFLEIDKELSEDDQERMLDSYLEEFFYNSFYANTQIVQIMTTDLAYYRDAIDFQKRWKQILAAGTRLNTNSEYGKEIEKSIYLKDDIITASFYSDLEKVLTEHVKQGRLTQDVANNILEKYKEVNVTDAQSYRTLQSFRSVLDMQGLWTDEMQECFDRLENGEWDVEDLSIVWQTLKPFMFATTKKTDSNGKAHRVAVQHKNSEALLLQMYSFLLPNSITSSKLRALNDYMVKNDIDVAHFESAVKVGKEGIINLNYSRNKLEKWLNTSLGKMSYRSILEDALKKYDNRSSEKIAELSDYDLFKEGNDILLKNNQIDSNQYNERLDAIQLDAKEVTKILEERAGTIEKGFNSESVHELPYRSYVVQQPNPPHLKDTEALMGTQFMNMLFTNVDPSATVEINGKSVTVKELKDLYDSLLVEKKIRGWEKVREIFGSDEALSEELTRLVKGNPKYGIDVLESFSLKEEKDPETGITKKVFVTPLNHPSVRSLVVPLLSSIFKNKITKTKIKGGTATLMSSFGLTKKLRIELNEDGSIKKIPCFLPAYTKKFFEPYMDKKTGVIDIKEIPEELLKIVGYRIPTEAKYSMLPLTIVGFLPENGGTSIMLPAEITTMSGADFDIDKLFMIFPTIKEVISYDLRRAWDDFYKENPDIVSTINANQRAAFNESLQQSLKDFPNLKIEDIDVEEEFNKFTAPYKKYEWAEGVKDAFSEWFKPKKSKYAIVKGAEAEQWKSDKEVSKQTMGAIDNTILNIAHTLLSSKHVAPDIFKPGNFDTIKREHLEKTILTDKGLLKTLIDLYPSVEENAENIKNISSKVLKDFIDEYSYPINPVNPSTFYYFHHQNMTGLTLIGNYALANVIYSKYQGKGLSIIYEDDELSLTIDGNKLLSLSNTYDFEGKLISDNLAEFAAASVDNAKNPVLHSLRQNSETANVATFLLMAGCTIRQVSALFNSPLVKQCIEDHIPLKNLDRYLIKLEKEGKPLCETSKINNSIKEYTLSSGQSISQDAINAAEFIKKAAKKASGVSLLKRAARADTTKGALATTLVDMERQVETVGALLHSTINCGEALLKNGEVSDDLPVEVIRNKFEKSPISLLQASYSLGVEYGYNTIVSYFFEGNPNIKAVARTVSNCFQGTLDSVFYKDLWRFILSKTQTFSKGGYYNNRKYYLKKFPEILRKAKLNNKEFQNLDVSKQLSVIDGNIETFNLIDMSKATINQLQSELDYMLSSGNNNLRDLAIGLYIYNFHKDGLHLSNDGVGLLFSPRFHSAFIDVDAAVREAKGINLNLEELSRYAEQFILNNASFLTDAKEEYSFGAKIEKLDTDGYIKAEAYNLPSYIRHDDKLYVKVKKINSDTATYKSLLSIPKGITKIYDYNTSNMFDIYNDVVKQEALLDKEIEERNTRRPSFKGSEESFTFTVNGNKQNLTDFSSEEGNASLKKRLC